MLKNEVLAHRVKILADVREAQAGVGPALGRLGIEVQWTRLSAADYLVQEGVGVERKTVTDLHESVRSGRLWRQATMLRRSLDRSFLLVEGVNLDGGSLSPDAVRGALLALIEQDVVVLRSTGPRDTAVWLRRLAIRTSPNAPHRRGRRRGYARAVTGRAVLATIPGISPRTAEALLAQFGSVAGVAAAAEAALRETAGVGPVRARALKQVLTEYFPA